MLPLVVVVTLLVALLAASAQSAAWRATRAARQAWNGQRALLAADEGLARLEATWDPQTFAPRAIGNRTLTQFTTADGALVDVHVARTHPLIAWVEAMATSATAGTPRPAQRRVSRALHLSPPALPVGAALVALSPARLYAGALVSGLDDATVPDACGPWRDTASVAGVYALAPTIDPSATVAGLPATRAPADSARDAALWSIAWPQLQARSTPRALPIGTPPAIVAPAWRAVVVRDSIPLAIAGTVSHDGLLVIDGDVEITGTLHVRGLLVVNGAVDARSGMLRVSGAVIVQNVAGAPSHFGGRTAIRYSQCDMQRALSAVALPIARPFALWSER